VSFRQYLAQVGVEEIGQKKVVMNRPGCLLQISLPISKISLEVVYIARFGRNML
jgi:hypothetical protein